MLCKQLPAHTDILIVGGGPVGALIAQRLASCGHQVLLAEARFSVPDDPRALALSYASRQALERTGLWDHVALAPTRIGRVHVSQAGTMGRTALDAGEIDLPELGYTVRYAALARHAQRVLLDGAASVSLGTPVTRIRQLPGYAAVTLATPRGEHTLTCRLVILAEGGKLLGDLRDITPRVKSYEQSAVLAVVTPATPHDGIAYERFADDGPLALLPDGRDYMLVWTQTPAGAAEKLALADADFLAQINARLGNRAPPLVALGARASWPLALKTVDSVVGQRVVLVGNAAQTLHPVAGQGLNLGLRDALTLAELLAGSPAGQLGEPGQLARYRKLRNRDASVVTHFTDSLITLFESPSPLLKHARSLGLLALDATAPARRSFARQMVYGAR
ncbi:FAD-dependent monooxygenase [Chitinilyticum piscinae]|uniref:FAD-dependent monooxygenase n=1 Tax=Chitinilyticum piscinae TaxID=2866724 RepID=A0A8J7FMW3_9NEIS|nr:FAD-dependent monooxygenase [Chitinilyticum piscinae]MBE9611007.1 FAD-dependent monooxygenase [Chitinilyticum piscinae]